MRVPSKLLIFTFWIFSLSCTHGQDCLQSDINEENTEPLEKTSYANGEIVKVTCITGYTGMYKFKCINGQWEKTLDRKCSRRKCGHPGDVPNGDFRLLDWNTEFVFGVTVEYTCKKGYVMASRTNQRTCRNFGWDNTVPSCLKEEKSCTTPIVTNGFVQRDFTEKIIYYSCNPGYKPYLSETWWGTVTCENGIWTNEPRCILEEQSCVSPPKVDNALITSKPQTFYSSGSYVNYECRTNFTMNGNSKVVCRNAKWAEAPTCEEQVFSPIEPCKMTPEIYKEYNIRPLAYDYIMNNNKVTVYCNEGWNIGNGTWWISYSTASCIDGKLKIENKCTTKN